MSVKTIQNKMNLSIGAQHIRSKIKQARNNNYTPETSLNELIDYPILMANNIEISVLVADNRLYKIQIEDDCEEGFKNLLESGPCNPFNYGHEKVGHEENGEISEFGTGMKQAAVSTGDKFIVFTKVKNKYYKIVFEFPVMMNEKDVMKSYNPSEFEEISEEVFKRYHKYDTGSTLIIEEILPDVLSGSSIKNLATELENSIKKTYGRILLKRKDDLNLKLNDKKIEGEEDIYYKEECKPFTQEKRIIIKKGLNEKAIFLEKNEEENKFRKFNEETGNYKIIKGKELKDIMALENYFTTGYLDQEDNSMINIIGTGTQFCPDMNRKDTIYPKGETEIYKLSRFHGSINQDSSNGAKNYVKMCLEFESKDLGKLFGANYNKTINFRKDNEFTKAVKQSIKEMSSSLEYDTSNKKAEKAYEKAIEFGITVPTNKVPTKFRSVNSEETSNNNKEENSESGDQLSEDENIVLTTIENKDEMPIEEVDIEVVQEIVGDERNLELDQIHGKNEAEQDKVKTEEKKEENVVVEEKEKGHERFVDRRAEPALLAALRSVNEEDEEKDEEIEEEEVKIDEPNRKKLGPGEQTRQTKRNVKLTFENEIPKRIQEIEDEAERKEYEGDISELIYEMMMDKCDRHGNRQQFVVKRFRNTPWQELLPDLWEYCYNNKLDDEYVTGGSRLFKFMNK